MDRSADLQEIKESIPSVLLDIRYATENNFTGKRLYKEPMAYLLPEPLKALKSAADEFAGEGFKLVIFDAYRPPTVQDVLRQYCDDDAYVAEVSNHCRGITVDVSLAHSSGQYLDMGTDYDDFTPLAHKDGAINKEQVRNRGLLASRLEFHGFVQHPYEWWHFDFKPEEDWPIIKSVRLTSSTLR